ncbi:hypothetical protein [uncultured Tateyamaria sp.]|uniref:hypothetical protein n=1 Tax=Tateyamaria sp. 1078 TaxID=3417464 RepID=UPI00260F35F3|nr:hypothetical protein [uncultured Tateyamaria sp.]
MIRAVALLSFLALAACGADGEPVQPDASIGIGIGSGGVHAGGTIGVSSGPLRIGVSLF